MIGLVDAGGHWWGGDPDGDAEYEGHMRGGDWLVVALFTLFLMIVLPAAMFLDWWGTFDRPPRSEFMTRKE